MSTANSSKTVLITGATSGIGYELATLFAKDHYNLVIVSRSEEHLLKAAEDFKKAGAPFVTTIAQDLAIAGNAANVYEATKAQGIEVNILVNDAGFGEYGYFSETDLDKELKIIQLNIASLVHLTKLYLKDMLIRDEGRILQLASIASYQPTPLLAVYAASKAFVLSFTDALIDEVKETNVTLTALIPGATDTDFFNKAGAENTKAAQHVQDPAIVAKTGYEALLKGERHAVAPGSKKVVVMSAAMPNDQVAAMAHKQMEEAKK